MRPSTPILLQDHADRVPRFWRRSAWRRGAAAASGMSFCARAQAEPFRRARLLPPNVEIFEIPELTSSFAPGDAAAARAATGLHGDPAILWVGHLDANKDPLTVLEGVSAAARDLAELAALVLLCNVAVAGGRRSANRARRSAPRSRAPAGPRAARAGRAAHARGRLVRARQSPRRRQLGARRSDGHRRHARRDRHTVVARPDRQRCRRSTVAMRGLASPRNRAATLRGDARAGGARARASSFRRAAIELAPLDESSPPHTPASSSGRAPASASVVAS